MKLIGIGFLFLSMGFLWSQELVLDDFSDGDTVSVFGTKWEGISDQVMGGKSEIQVSMRKEGFFYLRMTGNVSLKNNGGFIQVKLPLIRNKIPLNASDYKGVKIKYRSFEKGTYTLHMRTSQNRFPWAHFSAPLPASPEWKTLELPWSSFTKQYTMTRKPDVKKVKSLSLTAEKNEFTAGIDISFIGLYR